MDDRPPAPPPAGMGAPAAGETLAGSVPPPGAPPPGGIPLGTAPVGPPPGTAALGTAAPSPSARASLYGRRPPLWRRIAAVAVGLILLGLTSWWLDLGRALAVWVLFSLFLALWPDWPPATAAEERVQAWPFEP